MGRRSALCKALGVAQINRGAMPPIRFCRYRSAHRRRYSQPLRLKKRPVPSDDITISTSDIG